MKREIILTSDGSKSIYLPELDENYHSGHGALQEARHIFIENGLKSVTPNPLRIFEMGFGTGLNTFLSFIEAFNSGRQIEYTGIEAYPVESELIRELNYAQLIDKSLEKYFNELHNSAWDVPVLIHPNFVLTKIQKKIEDFAVTEAKFDLIYFDAFGPRAQAEMWDISILEKMYAILDRKGVLVTYCAKGQFKRDLKALGFIVESLPGPPGKREMTKAVKL